MKQLSFFAALLAVLFITACSKDDDTNMQEPAFGNVEVEFDNVFGPNDNQRGFSLEPVGSSNYAYTNALGQEFNVSLLRYFISGIRLEGHDGLVFEDEMKVDATTSKGYYLIDEADFASQVVELKDVPAGEYHRIVFTLGVDSTGVLEGAAGGVLDPATNRMFWNWNSGYVAMKFEGQSSAAAGGANGELINPDMPNGLVAHIGGWKDIPGSTAFVNNVKEITLEFDGHLKVEGHSDGGHSHGAPRVHLEFDVAGIFDGPAVQYDFGGNNNVHRPVDSRDLATNAAAAFRFDHIHE